MPDNPVLFQPLLGHGIEERVNALVQVCTEAARRTFVVQGFDTVRRAVDVHRERRRRQADRLWAVLPQVGGQRGLVEAHARIELGGSAELRPNVATQVADVENIEAVVPAAVCLGDIQAVDVR